MFNNQHFITRLLSATLVTLSLVSPCLGYALPSQKSDDNDRAFLFFGKKKNKNHSETSDSTPAKSDYDKLVEDAPYVSQGLFNVIRQGEDYYFEIPKKYLGKPMLAVNKFVKVPA